MPPRLPYVPEDLKEPREVVDAVRARRGGGLLNLDRQLLHSPPIAQGWNALLGAIRTQTRLNPRFRELAMCVVAVINRAEYEFVHHAPLLMAAGASAAQIEALRDVDGAIANTALFDEAERTVIELTAQSTRRVEVDDALFARMRRHVADDREAFELVATIAAYNMVSRVLVALGVEPE